MRASIPASIEPFGSPRDQGVCWGDTHGGGIPSSLASAARPPRRGRGERYARWPPGAAAGSATASAKKPNCRIKESIIVPEPGALGRGAPEAKVARQGPRSDAWKSAAARPGRAARRRGSNRSIAYVRRLFTSTREHHIICVGTFRSPRSSLSCLACSSCLSRPCSVNHKHVRG